MKRFGIVTMVLILAAVTPAELVDNFQNYNAGLVNAGVTGGVWDEITDASSAPRISDDAGNKFMQIGGVGNFVRGTFRKINPVTDTNSAVTLFVRTYYTSNSQDFSMGLTDVAVPGADFGNFEVQILSRNGADATHVAFGGRDGGAAEDYMQLELNRWYNIWAVIDQTTDSYDLYVTTDYANATEANKVNPDPVNFRNGTTADLVNFMGLVNNRNQNFRLDDIYLTQGKVLTNPVAGQPYGPSVSQLPAGTQVSATLNWKAGADGDTTSGNAVLPAIVDQYVFVGPASDPNLYYQGKTGDPVNTPDSQLIAKVDYDTAYRWVVVEVLPGYEQALTVGASRLIDVDPNNIIGIAWPFTSLASVPAITTDITPNDIRVEAGGSASYTVLFFSATTPTVKWYKYVDGVSDTLLNPGGDITITTGPQDSGYATTLQIDNVEEADQGAYYCTIDNIAPDPAIASKQAVLFIKKLLAQYTFEQNLNDSSPNGAPAGDAIDLSLADPNLGETSIQYLTGDDRVEGNYALKIDGIGQYIDFGTTAYPRALDIVDSGVGAGLDEGTIVCWVKGTQIGTLLSNYNQDSGTGFRLSLADNAGAVDTRMNFRGETVDGAQMGGATQQGRSARPAWAMFDGAWHLVASTWNADSTLRVYVDGQEVISGTAGVATRYADWQRGVTVGAVRINPADRSILGDFYGGLIDNLRIYNYELDGNTIAAEYLNVTGIYPCINANFEGNAYNYDNTGLSYCKIDLADFAVFAENWLANGLYMGQ